MVSVLVISMGTTTKVPDPRLSPNRRTQTDVGLGPEHRQRPDNVCATVEMM